MVDVGKREDRLLDHISELTKARESVARWLEIMLETGMISEDAADTLSRANRGLEG